MVSFTSRPLYLRGKEPGTHLIEVWVDTRAGLDAVAGGGGNFYCRESQLGRPAHRLDTMPRMESNKYCSNIILCSLYIERRRKRKASS
jgi:hypothetical protein